MTDRGLERSPVGSVRAQMNGPLPRDPFEILDELGHRPPYWVANPGDVDGYWVVTRYADAVALLQDVENFSSTRAHIPIQSQMETPMIPIETDPPETQRIRKLLMARMTAAQALKLEPRMRELAAGIIAGFRDRGSCDAVLEFARVYPIAVFLEFFGLPPERGEEFRAHAHRFLRKFDPQDWKAIRAIVEEQVQAKRRGSGEDLLSAIATSELDGVPLELPMAVNLASTVFLGGLETLPSNLGWSLRHLATDPDARERIAARPERIPAALEELLRLYSVANPLRRAVRDLEFRGARMRADDRIHVSLSSANRDPAEFGRGVHLDREPNRHLGFGAGPHRCVGSHLARRELRVALEEWHSAIPVYRIARDARITYQGPIYSMDSLPLEWDV